MAIVAAMALHHRAFLRLRHPLAFRQNQSAGLPFRQPRIRPPNFPFLQPRTARIALLLLAVFQSFRRGHPRLLAPHCLQNCQGPRPTHQPYRALQSDHVKAEQKIVDYAMHLQDW